jgi:hypothetical protein
MEWNRMESNGIEWNRMESNGIECLLLLKHYIYYTLIGRAARIESTLSTSKCL